MFSLLPFLRLLLALIHLVLSAESSPERRLRLDYDQPEHLMDRAELEALFQVMDNLVNDSQWRTNHPHPCSYDPWPGLECQQLDDYLLHVTKIDVGSNPKTRCKQNASISPAISKLPHLKALVLMSCFLSGSSNTTIPSHLIRLAPSLEILTLRGNSGLRGSIPRELAGLRKLEVLSLSQNGLQGELPAELGGLEKLQNLELSYNLFTGAIPDALGHIGSLSILDLSSNRLRGRIPESLGKLAQLKKLDLSNNQLEGSIPGAIGSLSMLQFLALDRNNLTGGLPSELQRLGSLQSLLLQDNPMHSGVPDFWGSLGRISELRLSNSGYTGTIPASIVNLRNLTELAMDRNSLTGIIPVTLESLPSIYQLNLSNNQLLGSVPFTRGFVQKMGENLDLHGNSGLCVGKSIAGSEGTSNLRRCDETGVSSSSSSSLSSSSQLIEASLFLLVSAVFLRKIV